MAAFASVSDLKKRYDVRRLCQLATDTDVEVDEGDLTSNVNILAALDDAHATVLSAVTVGQRYTEDDLADLTGTDLALVLRLCCDLAYGYLILRRGFPAAEVASLAPGFGAASQLLERLKLGEAVFAFTANRDAGKKVRPFTPDSNSTHLPLSSIVRVFGFNRLKPIG